MHPIIQSSNKNATQHTLHFFRLMARFASLKPTQKPGKVMARFVSKMNIRKRCRSQVVSPQTQTHGTFKISDFFSSSKARFNLANFMVFCSLARSWNRTNSLSTLGAKRKKSGTQKKSIRKDGSNLKTCRLCFKTQVTQVTLTQVTHKNPSATLPSYPTFHKERLNRTEAITYFTFSSSSSLSS